MTGLYSYKCRLAGPIGSDKAVAFTWIKVDAGISEKHLGAVLHAKVGYADHVLQGNG